MAYLKSPAEEVSIALYFTVVDIQKFLKSLSGLFPGSNSQGHEVIEHWLQDKFTIKHWLYSLLILPRVFFFSSVYLVKYILLVAHGRSSKELLDDT